jgi:glycosyltransferase involved in cell wall biosynthesis
MHILFIIPYPPGKAPSQRFRFEQYLFLLREKGIGYRLSPFLDFQTWRHIYSNGKVFSKILGIIKGYFRRMKDLLEIKRYDYVFIHREAAPIGPPVFEWLISKVFGKKIIYDFDDAIWIPNHSEYNSIMFYLKRYSNTRSICRWAYRVSCGNKYLCTFAGRYNRQVAYNPTTIDTVRYHNRLKDHSDSQDFVIGWTGTHSTLQYLEPVIPVIASLEKEHRFTFLVISDKNPGFALRSFVFRKWEKQREIEDLLLMNVGLMPLPDDKWANGKCGFKALQYNALGIPALVSPVGINTEIIQDYVNGFVCFSENDWRKYLLLLMNNRNLLRELGLKARPLVERSYSVSSNASNFLKLFS